MPKNYKTILVVICSIALAFLISFFYLSSFPTQTKNQYSTSTPNGYVNEMPSKGISKPQKPVENPTEGVMCAADVKQCADGSYVSRIAPSCAFATCPTTGVKPTPTPTDSVACTMDAKMCPDGSYVGRSGPKCEFAACP